MLKISRRVNRNNNFERGKKHYSLSVYDMSVENFKIWDRGHVTDRAEQVKHRYMEYIATKTINSVTNYKYDDDDDDNRTYVFN